MIRMVYRVGVIPTAECLAAIRAWCNLITSIQEEFDFLNIPHIEPSLTKQGPPLVHRVILCFSLDNVPGSGVKLRLGIFLPGWMPYALNQTREQESCKKSHD